jgi:hypothetical protein
LHPDNGGIFWTKDTLLPRVVTDEVRATLRWSLDELAALLEVIDENGIDPGSIGQSIYMVIFEDPGCSPLLRKGGLESARNDELAGRAAYLAVAHADHQQEEWEVLLGLAPALRSSFVAPYINEGLAHGTESLQ